MSSETNETIPESILFQCPECHDTTEHRILKARMGKANVTGTFQCKECGRIFTGTIRLPKDLTVKVLFSDGDQTETTETILKEDEIVEVGDEFTLDDGRNVCITFIDNFDGTRQKSCQATNVKALWVKNYDVLHVKVSVNDYKKTYSLSLDAEPDDEFAVGMTLPYDKWDCLIHAIKTKKGLIRRGSAEARDIVRIYGKIRHRDETDAPMDLDESADDLPAEEGDDVMDFDDQ